MLAVSVIIPTHNEGENLKKTVDSIIENTNFENYEIIVVDDSSKDNSTKFLENEKYHDVKLLKSNELCPNKTRNIGAKKAKGKNLIFLDAHVFPITPNWMYEINKLIEEDKKNICGPCITAYDDENAKGYGCTIKGPKLETEWLWKKKDYPYEVPIIGAACLGINKKTFFKINGFNDNFISWGYDDIELCIRAWLLGCKVLVLPQIDVYHIFRGTFPYEVKNDNVNFNLLVTAFLHFNSKTIKYIISKIKMESDISKMLTLLKEKKIIHQRNQLLKRRYYNDYWFFQKFNIEI